MKSRHLGEDSPELRARLAQAEQLKAEGEARAQAMARLTRLLRAEGFITTNRDTGSLLTASARAGVFRLGGTVIGTAAEAGMRAYQPAKALAAWRSMRPIARSSKARANSAIA